MSINMVTIGGVEAASLLASMLITLVLVASDSALGWGSTEVLPVAVVPVVAGLAAVGLASSDEEEMDFADLPGRGPGTDKSAKKRRGREW